MAKEYHQGKHSLNTLDSHLSLKAKKDILSLPFLNELFLETNDGKVSGAIFQYKTTNSWEDVQAYSAAFTGKGYKMSASKVGSHIDHKVGAKTIRLYKSGGRLQNIIDADGNALSSKQPTTAQQEDGVVVTLNHGLFDPAYVKETVGFAFDKSWNDSFEKTFNAIKTKINPKNYVSYRDSNSKKPKFLNDITDESILPDKKDNWNPADLWMVKNGYDGKNLLNMAKAVKSGDASIMDLNAEIMKEFDSGRLYGISLKKVGATATFKKVTVDKDYTSKLTYKGISKKNRMSVLNSYMDVYTIMEVGEEFEYLIRLRPKGKSGSLKVYFEGKPPSRGTFDGAVSKKLLDTKYFKGKLDEFEKVVMANDSFKGTFRDYIGAISPELSDFISKKNDYVELIDMDKKESNTYYLQRGAVITYCLYLMSIQDQKKFFKDCTLSAMKLNDFSSVYYKVF